MAVEKLLPAKFTKIKLRQDALQTTFLVFLDIFYPPNSGCFGENGVFQQPRLFAAIGNSYVKEPGQEVGLSSGSLVHAAQMGASHLRFPARGSTFALDEGIYRPSQEDNHKIP